MFCYQCQETAGNKGCTVQGVCGKTAQVAAAQDFLLWVTKGLAYVARRLTSEGKTIEADISRQVVDNLFVTITNANFDLEAVEKHSRDTVEITRDLRRNLTCSSDLPEAARFDRTDTESIRDAGLSTGIMAETDEDIRSLKELAMYGLKGLCAYIQHASVLGYEEDELYDFVLQVLEETLRPNMTVEQGVDLVLRVGAAGVKGMALLDRANTGRYGHPEISTVSLEAGKKPGILVSGHDLGDLEQLLKQTEGTGIDVYTHSEMLPAHYYPAFKKYPHFVGNYGNAWWKQKEEFEKFNGPVLMTTNCIVPPKESYRARMFTTGSAGYPGCRHIEGRRAEEKDFSPLIELAKQCPAPEPLEQGRIIGGFAHLQVTALKDKIVEAVKSGAIRKFVVMGGCDGRHAARSYYTDFAQALPKDTVILTAGCAKYRYNKLDLGDINGIPRVLDAGQCNDSYSLALIALTLKEAFGLEDINQLPLVFNIAWYEQKAVIVLLALLSLGVKNIHLGPTLPAFLSPNVTKLLISNFGIGSISSVQSDMAELITDKQ